MASEARGVSGTKVLPPTMSWTADGTLKWPSRGWICRGICQPEEERELVEIWTTPPVQMQVYKSGARSVVGSYKLRSGRTICLKYYTPKNRLKRLTYGLRGSRCLRSWKSAFLFGTAGLPTPAPIAMIERKRLGGFLFEQALLVTENVEGILLRDYVKTYRAEPRRLQKVAENLRECFKRMAENQIVHGDPKASNILVLENGEIIFTDLDASARSGKGKWRKGRERDGRIFADNWKGFPVLAEVFQNVFRG